MITKLASERLGRPSVAYNAAHDNFHISKNRDQVLKDFEKAGFTDIKSWYQPANWYFEDGKDFLNLFVRGQIKATGGADLDTELEQAIVEVFDELNAVELRTFEVLVILGTK